MRLDYNLFIFWKIRDDVTSFNLSKTSSMKSPAIIDYKKENQTTRIVAIIQGLRKKSNIEVLDLENGECIQLNQLVSINGIQWY